MVLDYSERERVDIASRAEHGARLLAINKGRGAVINGIVATKNTVGLYGMQCSLSAKSRRCLSFYSGKESACVLRISTSS